MTTTVSFTLDGKPTSAEVEPHPLLVGLLRDQLGHTGTHVDGEQTHEH
jgi:carbon-monoxide dehydrogenase small subunit